MNAKKILIVGGSGYVGREFITQLNGLGNSTHSISRSNGYDVRNGFNLLRHFKENEFDYSIFLSPVSGLIDPFQSSKIPRFELDLDNVFSSLSKISNSRIIYFSSNNVFSGKCGPYDVSTTPDGSSWFAYAKLYAEKLCKKYFERHLIIRTSLLIDNNYSSAFLSWVKNSLCEEKKIGVRDDIIVSPTLVSTVVSDAINIITQSDHSLVHLSSTIQTSKFRIAHAIAKSLHLNPNLIYKENCDERYPINSGNYCLVSNYPGETQFSANKIKQLIGANFD